MTDTASTPPPDEDPSGKYFWGTLAISLALVWVMLVVFPLLDGAIH